MINVLIVHEFNLMCNIIATALEREADIQVIGTVTNVEEALARLNQESIDILLLSTRLPDQGSLRLVNTLLDTAPQVKVVVMGISDERQRVLQYVEAGANGYVLDKNSLSDLLATIRATHAGESIISPKIATALIERIAELAHSISKMGGVAQGENELTEREIEVLELISQGLTNQEIAERLVIELGTVKNHVHSILNKLGVEKREDAASLLGLVHMRQGHKHVPNS